MPEQLTIHDLFVGALQDIYHAEKQLTKALPRMAKKTGNSELRDCLHEHLEETWRQCERLQEAFDELGMRAKTKPSEAMRGLIEEILEAMREDMPPQVLDVTLVACAQKIKHYEIASYGTLITLANTMEHDNIVSLLQETLEEERHADEKLTELAESEINPAALENMRFSNMREAEYNVANYGRSRQQRERYAEMQRMVERVTHQPLPPAMRVPAKTATRTAAKPTASRARRTRATK